MKLMQLVYMQMQVLDLQMVESLDLVLKLEFLQINFTQEEPMGINDLTTFKYKIYGQGQVRTK